MSIPGTRLNKFLASCGVASRRGCDSLIQEGLVQVNGEVCTQPGTRVLPGDSVKCRGKLHTPKETYTIALHKPAGLVCTRADEEGRPTIYSLLPKNLHHLTHAGRLDLDSAGLLIMTNDGDLGQELTHPRKSLEKLYHVTLEQAFENEALKKLLDGVYTPEGKAKAKSVRRMSARRLEMVLTTGLKRQIRYMLQAVGHRVKKLTRVQIGSYSLGDLEEGHFVPLNRKDLDSLLSNPAPKKQRR